MIDFIMALTESEGFGSIMVVVDSFSKYSNFMAASTDYTTEEEAKLFLCNIVKLCGIPKSIIRDRDPRFTRHFGRSCSSS